MKHLSTSLVIAALLAGCTVPNFTIQPPATTKPSKDPASTLAAPDKLNGIEFKPINASAQRLSGNSGTAESAAAPASATTGAADSIFNKAVPMPAPQSPGMTKAAPGGGAFSGNMHSYYGYGGYFGGFGNSNEPMALVSMTGAELAGSKGTFQEILKAVVSPVTKEWAPDARLVQSNASVGASGAPVEVASDMPAKGGVGFPGAMPYWGEESAWRFTYISVSRNEVLNFTVSAAKTTIVRMKYAPLDLSPERVTVDSGAALAALIKAIEDKSAKSEEEASGKDYFMGLAFDAQQGYFGPGNRIEVVYDVPDNARWNINLQQILGKLVWEMNYYAPSEPQYAYGRAEPAVAIGAPAEATLVDGEAEPDAPVSSDDGVEEKPTEPTAKPLPPDMPAPPPYVDPGFYFNNSASGMVDAQTGAVIRFSRPFKNFYEVPKAYPVPVEKGMPVPMPMPMPEVKAN